MKTETLEKLILVMFAIILILAPMINLLTYFALKTFPISEANIFWLPIMGISLELAIFLKIFIFAILIFFIHWNINRGRLKYSPKEFHKKLVEIAFITLFLVIVLILNFANDVLVMNQALEMFCSGAV